WLSCLLRSHVTAWYEVACGQDEGTSPGRFSNGTIFNGAIFNGFILDSPVVESLVVENQ
ncbi:MAG: hypothetical protein ACJATP_001591, partial [Candidatus Azotimanducaceae bacterium]